MHSCALKTHMSSYFCTSVYTESPTCSTQTSKDATSAKRLRGIKHVTIAYHAKTLMTLKKVLILTLGLSLNLPLFPAIVCLPPFLLLFENCEFVHSPFLSVPFLAHFAALSLALCKCKINGNTQHTSECHIQVLICHYIHADCTHLQPPAPFVSMELE